MGEFSLRCFGTGDGWPSADRGHSSFLYRFGNASLLVDCGEPVTARFRASGSSWDLIDSIFLSHLHFDHLGGFFMLMQGFWVEGRTKQLVVHAPAVGILPLKQLLRAACLLDELLPFRLQFETLQPREPVLEQGVKVTPFPTTHLARLQRTFPDQEPALFAAFSFLLESGNLRIGHTADIGAVADLGLLLEKPLDLLVCELAHVPPEELFPFLRGRNIGRVVFVHLAREVRARFEEVRALARERLGEIQFTFAGDGDEFRL